MTTVLFNDVIVTIEMKLTLKVGYPTFGVLLFRQKTFEAKPEGS
jgi:hypothetical protein